MADEDVLIELAAAVTRLSGTVEMTAQALQRICDQLGADPHAGVIPPPNGEPPRRIEPRPAGRSMVCLNPRSFALQVIEGGLSTSAPRPQAPPPD